jgi:hypothetical protein
MGLRNCITLCLTSALVYTMYYPLSHFSVGAHDRLICNCNSMKQVILCRIFNDSVSIDGHTASKNKRLMNWKGFVRKRS